MGQNVGLAAESVIITSNTPNAHNTDLKSVRAGNNNNILKSLLDFLCNNSSNVCVYIFAVRVKSAVFSC